MNKLFLPLLSAALFVSAAYIAKAEDVPSIKEVRPAQPAGSTNPFEVPVDADAPKLEQHPLSSVVITQCDLIVAVYITTTDGRLLRFDKSNEKAMQSDQLLTAAYAAAHSERIEVSCNDNGIQGFEKHGTAPDANKKDSII